MRRPAPAALPLSAPSLIPCVHLVAHEYNPRHKSGQDHHAHPKQHHQHCAHGLLLRNHHQQQVHGLRSIGGPVQPRGRRLCIVGRPSRLWTPSAYPWRVEPL